MGLEPTRLNSHKILSLARLPVPTLPRVNKSAEKDLSTEKFKKFLLSGEIKNIPKISEPPAIRPRIFMWHKHLKV